ncbi:MAG: thermonuclease family protein [Pseudomonadota bacterium]
MLGGCLLTALAQAETFEAEVVAVLDGDTVIVRRDNHPVRIRLADIDAPEKIQPYGDASRRSLEALVLHKRIECETRAVDRYRRTVALLRLEGKSVNAEQLRRGMAWEYSYYHSNRAYRDMQKEARKAQRGLWADDSPIPPWQWRKAHAAELLR